MDLNAFDESYFLTLILQESPVGSFNYVILS